ncbi:hypothetical protein Dimus_027020, partial [Dionaea muscipula]
MHQTYQVLVIIKTSIIKGQQQGGSQQQNSTGQRGSQGQFHAPSQFQGQGRLAATISTGQRPAQQVVQQKATRGKGTASSSGQQPGRVYALTQEKADASPAVVQ